MKPKNIIIVKSEDLSFQNEDIKTVFDIENRQR